MADTEPNTPTPTPEGWMSDVQRAIALILIGSFALVTIFSTGCSVFWPEATALVDMAKTTQAALVNMSLIALGFFFGNTMAKMAQDRAQQGVVEKLTGPTGFSASASLTTASAPTVVVSWWSLLTAAEQAAIETASPADVRVAAILTALKTGKAEAPDLVDLVSKGLLTQARADLLKAA